MDGLMQGKFQPAMLLCNREQPALVCFFLTLFCSFVLIPAAFPESQAAATETVRRVRQKRAAEGVDLLPYLSMEDHLAAMEVRLVPVADLGGRLRAAAEEIYKVLWPGLPVPETALQLAKWLATAPGRSTTGGRSRLGLEPRWRSPSCCPGTTKSS